MRFVISRLLRKDSLCRSPELCPDSPDCESRCPACPITRLEAAMQSPLGQMIRRIHDLDFALEKGFQVSFDEVSAVEFKALRILALERQALDEEKREAERQRQALERMRQSGGGF